MLISRVVEDNPATEVEEKMHRDDAQDYQTVDELYELMAKTSDINTNDEGPSLCTRDLILLYKKVDLGTQTITAEKSLQRKPNQYVETVVYNEDPDSDNSDVSEFYSIEDLRDVFMINNERIDLLNSIPSIENTLCSKFGNLQIHSSNITSEYNKHLLHKDLFTSKWDNLNLLTSLNEFSGNIIPSSLLNYICCQNFDGNYDVYMDNVIRYVIQTIEQLKRISNGDYLTDRVREKWRKTEERVQRNSTDVLTTTASIPLQIVRKNSGHVNKWNDMAHSAVDMRSLSKILGKKIIVEIPKLIPGSCTLFTKCRADNLVVICKIEENAKREKKKSSRFDMLYQLKRSNSGHVLSNIDSVVILNTKPYKRELPIILPLPYKEVEFEELPNNELEVNDAKVDIFELEHSDHDADNFDNDLKENVNLPEENQQLQTNNETEIEIYPNQFFNSENEFPKHERELTASESSLSLKEVLVAQPHGQIIRTEASFSIITPDELQLTMMRLNNQCALPEESEENVVPTNKKRSPTRNRIKSPYENNSHTIEEKKRRRLLEIREKRERKKMSMNENCKITKHKNEKTAVCAIPQASNSVTKLSITNKYFYSSIYGNNLQIENKLSKSNIRQIKKESYPESSCENLEAEYNKKQNCILTGKSSKKYIDRSYYLDDAVTEIMCLDMKQKENNEVYSGSASVTSNDTGAELKLLTHIINPSASDLNAEKVQTTPRENIQSLKKLVPNVSNIWEKTSSSTDNVNVPFNSPKRSTQNESDKKDSKRVTTVECKNSINKIYDLMRQLKKINPTSSKPSVATVNEEDNASNNHDEFTIGCTNSGTSVKHQLPSSTASNFSFGKVHDPEAGKNTDTTNTKTQSVVPKVIINTKPTPIKIEEGTCKKLRKKLTINPHTKVIPNNPLKAISQLLHEFDNIHKTKRKLSPEIKSSRKSEVNSTEARCNLRLPSTKTPYKIDELTKSLELSADRSNRSTISRGRKSRPNVIETSRIPRQAVPVDDKHVDRISKRKLSDIIDEAKEARGEAVRGPSKPNSRLDTLAQPKRSYVQAHSEEYQNKYGRNLMTDRLQRLAATPTTPERILTSTNIRNKRKKSPEITSLVSVKQIPPTQCLEKTTSPRQHSANSSPRRKATATLNASIKQNVFETLEKKKNTAVESYLNCYYGHESLDAKELLEGGHKSRAPLVPDNIGRSTTSSPTAEESSTLGTKLHYIVNTIISNIPPTDKESKNEDEDHTNLSRVKGPPSVDSDYPIDILEDKNVLTAVESFENNHNDDVAEIFDIVSRSNLQTYNSTTQLGNLENILYQRMSTNNFRNPMRMEDIKLTPKHSLQRVLLLQSGDASTLLVKSTLSQNLKISSSKLENSSTLNSYTHLDWKFNNFPVQVATVGYAFPQYNISCSSSKIKNINNCGCKNTDLQQKSSKCDKHIQCFNITQIPLKEDHGAQADFKVINGKDKTADYVDDLQLNNNVIADNGILTKELEINEASDGNIKSEEKQDVGYTTSLDMLVGLLNEIQKISLQTHAESNMPTTFLPNRPDEDLENILNNATDLEGINNNLHEIVSITSLDKLRQLESSPSIISFCVSNDEEPNVTSKVDAVSNTSDLVFMDKEVYVDFAKGTFCNTNVSSQRLPAIANHSTNVTNSLIGVLSEPSSQSMFHTEYQTLYSDLSFHPKKKIIELPRYNKSVFVFQNVEEMQDKNVIARPVETNNSSVGDVYENNELNSSDVFYKFDPNINMKRDILVTVYSILVITVFAALSFPEILLIYSS